MEICSGLNGLETLGLLKAEHPSLPVLMVTVNEEEHIMEDAIWLQDYPITLLNPLTPIKSYDHLKNAGSLKA